LQWVTKERQTDEVWKRKLRGSGAMVALAQDEMKDYDIYIPTFNDAPPKYVPVELKGTVKEAVSVAGNKVREGVNLYIVHKLAKGRGEYER
jgi:hypothetical protein